MGSPLSVRTRGFVTLLALGMAAALIGCGRGKGIMVPAPVPVGGTVVCQGKPLGGVVVTFWPQDQERQGVVKPANAVSEQDGTFKLSCPEGLYKVTLVVAPTPGNAPILDKREAKAPPKRPVVAASGIPEVYRRPESTPLSVTVPAEGAEKVTLLIP
jgi:hypothetical protein